MRLFSKAVFVLTIFIQSKAGAFQFTSDFSAGIYWASFPIAVEKFAVDSSEGALLSSLVSEAENAWEGVIGQEVWAISDGFQSGPVFGNNIRWSNNFAAETGFNPATTLAVTIRYRVGTFFSKFEIILNGENQVLRANVNNSLYQTILHELGHVLGLDHSSSGSAVMYASLAGINQLSQDDIEGAHAVFNESLRRQSVGFVSELATANNDEGNALACGSISSVGNDGPGSGVYTVLFGMMIAMLFGFLPKLHRNNFPLNL